MLGLSAEEAGRALKRDPLKTAVSGVSTDTRSLNPGDLFVALRGERFDGHDYVEAALAAEACGAVVEREAWAERRESLGTAAPGPGVSAAIAQGHIYTVDDTQIGSACARRYRQRGQDEH